MRVMQYHYALAEGAEYRPLRWHETSGKHQEFPNETELLKHAESESWDLITVIPSGKLGTYRQYYFKRSD